MFVLLTTILSTGFAEPTQPDPRGMAGPDRNFDLKALHLDLTLEPEKKRVYGTAKLEVDRLYQGPLVLNQVKLDISQVRMGENELTWRTRGENLIIEGVGQSAIIEIEYSANPRAGLHFREKDGISTDQYSEVWSQGENMYNRHWFPSWDYPNDRFMYTGDIKAPKGWKVITNSGVEMVNYLVMVAAAPYEIYGSGTNEVWVPPNTPKKQVDAVMEYVPSMHKHFTERTGVAYPWEHYRQIFVQRFIYGGMENTTATIMNDRYLRSALVPETNTGAQNVIAHELAHQWYGDLLTCRSWRELWLNEGFATFFASDWHKTILGEEHYAQSVRRWFRSSSTPYSLAGRYHQGLGDEGRGVYVKGASVLNMLLGILGEDIFWKSIQQYTKKHQNQLVETRDLQRAFEDVSGQNLGWFFQQWVELPHIPELTVRWSHGDEVLRVTVTQKDSPDKPFYTLPIEVEIGTQEGTITHKDWIDSANVQLSIPMKEAPKYVAFDPKKSVLAKVTYKQESQAWKEQLQSPSAHARLDAIYGLKESKGAKELEEIVNDNANHFVLRKTAAEQLGELGEAKRLLNGLEADDPRVRMGCVQGLSKTTDIEALPMLQKIQKTDPNLQVRGSALKAIAAIDPKKALSLARKEVKRSVFIRETMYDMLSVFREHGSISDIPSILEYGKRHGVRATVLWSLISMLERESLGPKRDAMRKRIARYTEGTLYDNNQRVRETSVRILGEVGDKQSIAHLKKLLFTETLSSFHESANKSIKNIRSRKDSVTSKTPNEEEARLKEMEERLKKLEEDYQKLLEKY